MGESRGRMRLSGHLMVFALVLGLVVVFTWPVMRAPDQLPPPDADPCSRLYILVTQIIARNLLTQPTHLLQGTAFYPFGNSITFAEPLLTPALVIALLDTLTRNAVFGFKATLILGWALSGWAMYAITFWLTRRHAAALVAALIFTLCPARLAYYGEFQIEMALGIPLAVYNLVRFLEEQRLRHLAGALVAFWIQAVAVVYYGVILGLGLFVLTVQYVALRWAGWRGRTLVAAAGGGLGLALALAPVAWPYFVTRQELGLERSMDDTFGRSADVLTYLTTTDTWLARFVPIQYPSETSLFVGLTALALAAASLAWLRRPAGERGGPERLLAGAVWVSLAATVLFLVLERPLRLGPVRSPFSAAGMGVLLLAIARHGAEGWRRWTRGAIDRHLGAREWVSLLLVLLLFAVLVSLGPAAHVAGHPLGGGLYAWLYPYVLPLHAIRAVTRVGILVVFAVALLAGFAMQWLGERLPARAGRVVAILAPALLLLEAESTTLPYRAVPTSRRPVDAVIRADARDVAVLEVPANVAGPDADAMFRAVDHGKRVVNGYAGFPDPVLRELSGYLSAEDVVFPSPAGQAALRRIYPLRYLVVRLADPNLAPAHRPVWLALRQSAPPLLRFRGTFGTEDLYEIVPEPEQALRLERWVSPDFLRKHPVLEVGARALAREPGLVQWLEVSVDRRQVGRVELGSGVGRFALGPPAFEATPDVIGLDYRYAHLPAARDARYRIGETGVLSPGDLRVTSVGGPEAGTAKIQLDGVDLSPDRRGYNLVALDGAGRVLRAEAFDTFVAPSAAGALAAWVTALPAGTIVVGAVRDEASRALTADAVSALRALGVAGDLRGRYREAHAFAGVKGAAPGTAREMLGSGQSEVTVGQVEVIPGRPPTRLGFELLAFTLLAN